MKQLFIILSLGLLLISCMKRTDLETLKQNENVLDKIKEIKELVKDKDPIYGLVSYRTDELQNFNFGEILFSKYEMEKGYNADYNDLFIHVDSYKTNKFIGITLDLVNQEQCQNFLKYLKKKYGKPESHSAQYDREAYFWDDKKLNQWVLVYKYDGLTRDDKTFKHLNCTIIKKGTRVENSTDLNFFSILNSFNMAHMNSD